MLLDSKEMPTIKLHHLRYFIAIARQESLHGAARLLGLAQPALTRGLRELEHEVGASLVERHARGISLTDTGERFLVRATSVLEDLRRAQEEAAQLKGQLTGTLSIGLSPVAQVILLPRVFSSFSSANPDVRLHIVEGFFPTVRSKLNDGSLDFYVGPDPDRRPGPEFIVKHLWKSERIVAARRGHPLAKCSKLKELANCNWQVVGISEKHDDEISNIFTSHGIPLPTHSTIVTSLFTSLVLLNSTDALLVLPKLCLSSPLFKDAVIALPLKEAISGPDIVQIRRTGTPLTPIAERFSEAIDRAVREFLL
jgi:LysR family transcriptional regulator of abg operon